MPANYVLLGQQTLSQSVVSITLGNIPQSGYTDLMIVVSARTATGTGTADTYIGFNASSTGYTNRYLRGNGTSATSGNFSSTLGVYFGEVNTAGSTANTFSNCVAYIPNYLSSNFKSVSLDMVEEENATLAYAQLNAGLWSNTAAITSLTIQNAYGYNFAANSTFSLYGIAAVGTTPVIAPFATGGDIITNDGTYWYHAFLSTGSFTPSKALSCDALVIAGGGGGGGNAAGRGAGGGGAGGLLAFTSQALTSSSYVVTVGAGGASGTNVSPGTSGTASDGTNGVDSQFGSLTLVKGGGGGSGNQSGGSGKGKTGGSGGGNWEFSNIAGGVNTAGQGNVGGSTTTGYGASGGGGAGAAGINVSTTTPSSSSGGAGVSTYSSWGNVTSTGQNISGTYWFAGGGGGGADSDSGGRSSGAGGNGGGGVGANNLASSSAAGAGTANTGGGGGGGGGDGGARGIAANGGSGIVIIRYPIA